MVICKYFLQGTCKFGDMCKFEHEVNNDSFKNYQNQNSTSILRQSNFGTSQQMKPANPSNVDTNTLVKSVVNDMTLAEKGGQWLLSCYAPFKEKPAFPGFEDYSFEEIRLGYYDAVKNGTLDQYKQQIGMLLQQAIMKIKSLQTPSPDIVNMLKNIYNTPPSSQAGVYGINTISNTFGNSANLAGTIVGQKQSSNFGQSGTSVFAQANQNLFGKPGQSQNNYSPPANIFGGVPQNTSIFSGSTSNSPFGSKQNQGQSSSNNLFSQASGQFPGQSTTPIFGGQISGQEKANSFFNNGQNTNNSIFGGTHTNTNIFTTKQTNSPLAAQSQVSNNVFGNTNSPVFNQNTTFTSPNNINTFGQSAPVTTNNIFAAAPNVQVSTTFGAPIVQNPQIPQQPSASIFTPGTNQTQNQIFANTSKSIFSNQQYQNQNANSLLGLLTKNTMETQNHSASIFGNNQQVGNPNLQVNPQQRDVDLEGIYSKLEDLTEDEIKWFQSNDLDILKIPEKPPTFEMCFKT